MVGISTIGTTTDIISKPKSGRNSTSPGETATPDRRTWRCLNFGIVSTTVVWLMLAAALPLRAEPLPVAIGPEQAGLKPDPTPLNLNQMRQGLCSASVEGVSATSISQQGLTRPSLWWTRDQFAALAQFGGKLLENWLACPGDGSTSARVDFIVNPQLWSLLDYLERYEFVNRFGAVASSYGYNIRIFNRRADLLAAYTCDFNSTVAQGKAAVDSKPRAEAGATPADAPTPATCNLTLNSSGKDGFRGQTTPLGAPLPTGSGTALP